MITHFGYNRTDCGHYLKPRAWIPVAQSDKGPVYQKLDAYDKVIESIPLVDWLKQIIDKQPNLCRIWVLHDCREQECVYYYIKDVLTLKAP